MKIRPFRPADQDAVVALVVSIQRDEFGFAVAAADHADLLDVRHHYQQRAGNFWVATDQGAVVGSVGLLDIGQGEGALRRMFVAPSHRGGVRGTAAALLDACLTWARAHGSTRVLLGTTERFAAAHRFYEKAGFRRLEPSDLPARFPRMALDTRFYAYTFPTDPMNVTTYLARIGYDGPLEPSAETLTALHVAHLRTVPFENLDILLSRRIDLSLAAFYEKIVRRRRGGFCYELNGLFGWLLEQLGFSVSLLSARVMHGSEPGPDFEHLLLLVRVPDPRIADVGFGESFLTPLLLERDRIATQLGASYRLTGTEPDWTLEQHRPPAAWQPQFIFAVTPRALSDFAPMCRFLQTDRGSPFTRKAVCSRTTPHGRITLAGNRFIETADGQRQERPVSGPAEYRALLRSHFDIELDQDAPIDRLLAPGRSLSNERQC